MNLADAAADIEYRAAANGFPPDSLDQVLLNAVKVPFSEAFGV
jgi:hypothetical protein